METITRDPATIKKVTGEYLPHLCTHKFDKLEDIDQFLKNYKLPRLKQNEINYVKGPISIRVIKFIIKKFRKHKSPSTNVFAREFYGTLKEK